MSLSEPYSKTRLELYNTCPRKYKYKYIKRRLPLEDFDWRREFGRTWHKGLELAYWKTSEIEFAERVRLFSEVTAKEQPDCAGPFMSTLFACYVDRWRTWEEYPDYECNGTETEYEAEIDGIKYMGIFDAQIQMGGYKKLIESKTTSAQLNPGSYYWHLDFALQPGLYEAVARAAGLDFDELVYDVVKLPSLREGKIGRTIIEESSGEFVARLTKELQKNYDKYFAREVVTPDAGVIADARATVVALENDTTFRRNSGSCNKWGRKCEYYEVCAGRADLTDGTMFKNKEKR